jgi:P5-type ATPase cation transporter
MDDTAHMGPHLTARVFRVDEEATKIHGIVCLRLNYAKIMLLVPLLAVCTGLFFLLFLFWMPGLRKKFFFSECPLGRATHLFISGTGISLPLVNDIYR